MFGSWEKRVDSTALNSTQLNSTRFQSYTRFFFWVLFYSNGFYFWFFYCARRVEFSTNFLLFSLVLEKKLAGLLSFLHFLFFWVLGFELGWWIRWNNELRIPTWVAVWSIFLWINYWWNLVLHALLMSSTGTGRSSFCVLVIIEVAKEHYFRGTCCEISSAVKFGYIIYLFLTFRHTCFM